MAQDPLRVPPVQQGSWTVYTVNIPKVLFAKSQVNVEKHVHRDRIFSAVCLLLLHQAPMFAGTQLPLLLCRTLLQEVIIPLPANSHLFVALPSAPAHFFLPCAICCHNDAHHCRGGRSGNSQRSSASPATEASRPRRLAAPANVHVDGACGVTCLSVACWRAVCLD